MLADATAFNESNRPERDDVWPIERHKHCVLSCCR